MILKKNNKRLGHTHVFKGYGSDAPYLTYPKKGGVLDGVKNQHVDLYGRCDICDKKILVARIHVDENSKLYTE